MSYSISHSILQTFFLTSINLTSFVTLQKAVKVLSPSYIFLHLSDRRFISQPFIPMILSLMYLTVVSPRLSLLSSVKIRHGFLVAV